MSSLSILQGNTTLQVKCVHIVCIISVFHYHNYFIYFLVTHKLFFDDLTIISFTCTLWKVKMHMISKKSIYWQQNPQTVFYNVNLISSTQRSQDTKLHPILSPQVPASEYFLSSPLFTLLHLKNNVVVLAWSWEEWRLLLSLSIYLEHITSMVCSWRELPECERTRCCGNYIS